jgi:hypothetical protein
MPPAYDDVRQEAEERPLLEDVTKQRFCEHKSVIVICKEQSRVVR